MNLDKFEMEIKTTNELITPADLEVSLSYGY